jgi:nucleoside-diphosphate-sugar epimerase
MQRVLVTGGTGVIGVEVVRLLVDEGVTPRVLVRRPSRASLLRALDIEPVYGDLQSAEAIARAVHGVDTVIHLGGRATFERYERLAPTLVEGTTSLARAAVDAGVEHLVFASSALVYGDQQTPIGADTPVDPQLGYGQAKVAAERRLAEAAQRSGLTVASVRLPHVYGPHSLLFQQVRQPVAVFPGTMTNLYSHLHVLDAARVLVAAARQRWVGVSPVADQRNATFQEFFDLIRTYHPELHLVRVPEWLGLAGTAVLEPVLSGRRRVNMFTRGTVVAFNLNLPIEPGPLWDDLRLKPVYPTIEEGIPAALDGYVQFRWRHPVMDRRRR